MQESGVFLSSVVAQFDNAVTTADMIQFGAAVAIVTCPLGVRPLLLLTSRPSTAFACNAK